MKFEKTYGDIKLLNKLSADSFGLDKMLKLMQDIMFDVHDETKKEFMDLPQSDSIISPWISIAGVLMSLLPEDIAAGLSERRREKISSLKKMYEEKLNCLKEAESEAEALNETECELNRKISKLETDYKNRLETKKYAATLKEKIENLQAEIDKYDVHMLEERLEEKESDYVSIVNKNDGLRLEISEMDNKLKRAEDEFENLMQAHGKKSTELENIISNHKKARAKLEEISKECRNIEVDTDNLNEEINSHKLWADQLKSDYDAALKKNIKEKGRIEQNKKELDMVKDEIEEAGQELKRIIKEKSDISLRLKELNHHRDKLEKEYNALNDEYIECEKSRKEYEKFFSSAECQKRKKEIESCNIVLGLYRNGIQQLFKHDADIGYLPDLGVLLKQKEKLLNEQLEKAENILCNLKSEYITIIEQIESEVN